MKTVRELLEEDINIYPNYVEIHDFADVGLCCEKIVEVSDTGKTYYADTYDAIIEKYGNRLVRFFQITHGGADDELVVYIYLEKETDARDEE